MTDEDLIHQLRNSKGWPTLGNLAADRIEALIAERDALVEAEARAASAAQEARAAALREAVRIKPDVEVRTDHWRHAALDQEDAYRNAILALLDTPAAEALERVQTEERAKGMERAGVILLDHPHWTRWHVLEAIRAEAAAIRAQETDNA